MSTDPRIEAAAKALWDCGRNPRQQGGSDWVYMAPEDERRQAFMSYATAALAAADNAATITTAEGLGALPADSVILADAVAYQKCGDHWDGAGRTWDTGQLVSGLPARAIHWGTE